MMTEPLGECDACGADLYPNQPHDCPVTGSTVTAEPMENTGQKGEKMDRQYVNPDHAGWYQATSDENREQHIRASHWPAWTANPHVMTAQEHADWHAKYQRGPLHDG